MTVRHGRGALRRPVVPALVLLVLAGAVASGSAAGADRIYCYFDPSAEDQVDRARALHRLTRDLPGVEWIAVTAFPATVPEMATASLADLLSDPSTPRSVVPWLRDRPGGVDHLLIDRQGELFDGPGREASQVIAEAGLSPASGPSTDVDVTTWGKVKDLFQ